MKTQNMIEMLETATPVLEALSTLFVFLIGLLALFIIIVFIFASSSSVGKGQLAKITVPTGLRFLVDPNATVVSVLLAALCTQSRSARLNGISSLSIAKKYLSSYLAGWLL
jgi:uncharacterized integral membrane protein